MFRTLFRIDVFPSIFQSKAEGSIGKALKVPQIILFETCEGYAISVDLAKHPVNALYDSFIDANPIQQFPGYGMEIESSSLEPFPS